MKFDWQSGSTEVLLNPRLAEAEARALREQLRALPELKAHFWVGTSGSTGAMKWVALSKRAALASARGVNEHLESGRGDVWLQALPSFHVGGLGIWARAHLSGARVVDLSLRAPKWEARAFHEACGEAGATLSALVPTQIYDLVQAGLRSPQSLRAIVVGGGALAPQLYQAARELGWRLLPSYGLTECASQVATAALASLEERVFPELCLLPHVEARTAPSGLIEIRSEALLTGYGVGTNFHDPRREGWFTTEDRGQVEVVPPAIRPVLRIQGRESSFLKIAGESVDFSRLERILEEARLSLGLKLDAVLVALPDERKDQAIHLAFAQEGLEAAIQAGRLAAEFNCRVLPLERIQVNHPVENIPRSVLGKVLRSELKLKLI